MDTYPGNFRNYQSSLFQIILGGLLEKHEISSFFASCKIFCVSAQGIFIQDITLCFSLPNEIGVEIM